MVFSLFQGFYILRDRAVFVHPQPALVVTGANVVMGKNGNSRKITQKTEYANCVVTTGRMESVTKDRTPIFGGRVSSIISDELISNFMVWG